MDDKDTSLSKDDDFIINIEDILADTISIDSTNMTNYYSIGSMGANGAAGPYGNVTISTSNSGLNGTWSSLSNSYITSKQSGLYVSTDAEFDGDVKIKGVSVLETLQKIEKRLAILRPDPAKLEHFEALKKAYEHYKTLEALCELPTKEEE